MVSGTGKPLGPALALLGHLSVWPVLLPPSGQPPLLAVCRRLTFVKSGKRKALAGSLCFPIRVSGRTHLRQRHDLLVTFTLHCLSSLRSSPSRDGLTSWASRQASPDRISNRTSTRPRSMQSPSDIQPSWTSSLLFVR